MFWSRVFKEIDKDDGIAMRAGVVVVEAEDYEKAGEEISKIEKRWKDGSYCVGLVMGPYKTREQASAR